MKVLSRRILLPIATVLCVCAPNAARAQAPLEPAQMSPRTMFYLVWRGVPSSDVRKANSLFALWDDADFAPVRSAMAAGMLGSSEEKSFCAGAFGDGGGDARIFRGKIGASENYAGAIPGIRGAAGKFVYGRVCERASEAKSFEWSRGGGCKDASVERHVFCI